MAKVLKTNPKMIGITGDTLNYFNSRIEDFGKVVKVDMVDYDGDARKYPMVISNNEGDKMYLGGVASGYGGEGARGSVEVIHKCGEEFSKVDPGVVFNNSDFTLKLVNGVVQVTTP